MEREGRIRVVAKGTTERKGKDEKMGEMMTGREGKRLAMGYEERQELRYNAWEMRVVWVEMKRKGQVCEME